MELLVVVLALIIASESMASLPPFIKVCSRNDENFDACVMKNAKEALPQLVKGDRKYKVPVLDPLKISEMKVTQDGGLNIIFTDVEMLGNKDIDLKSVRFDLNTKTMFVDYLTPVLTIVSKYTIDGKILILPITGEGNSNITMTDLFSRLIMKMSVYKEKDSGKENIKVDNVEFKYNTSQIYIHLDNLFNGDKLLGSSTNKFLNENWREVNKDVGPAVAEAIGNVAKIIFANFLEGRPYDEVFPESSTD